MEGGWVVAAGMRRSRAASTARRSSSKNEGSFIVEGKLRSRHAAESSRFALAFGIKGLSGKFAVGFFQENFHASLGFFELLLAFAREGHALFEEFHGVVERKLGAFKAADDFFEARQGALEIGFFRRFGFLGDR